MALVLRGHSFRRGTQHTHSVDKNPDVHMRAYREMVAYYTWAVGYKPYVVCLTYENEHTHLLEELADRVEWLKAPGTQRSGFRRSLEIVQDITRGYVMNTRFDLAFLRWVKPSFSLNHVTVTHTIRGVVNDQFFGYDARLGGEMLAMFDRLNAVKDKSVGNMHTLNAHALPPVKFVTLTDSHFECFNDQRNRLFTLVSRAPQAHAMKWHNRTRSAVPRGKSCDVKFVLAVAIAMLFGLSVAAHASQARRRRREQWINSGMLY